MNRPRRRQLILPLRDLALACIAVVLVLAFVYGWG